MDMPQESEVPEGWVSLTIQDVCDINPPKPKKGDLPGDTPVTFVPMPAVDAERGEISSPEIRPFSEVRSGFTAFKKGDVIMAKITPCMENGKAAVAKELVNDRGFGSTEFFVLRSNGSISPRYLFHYIRQRSFRSLAESNMTGSVGQKRVPKVFIQSTVIPLPPLPEQHRIVAAIEALFARLDATNARLERVPGILKQFRQAVLAAACDGRLTEDWRANRGFPVKNSEGSIAEKAEIPLSWYWSNLKSICTQIVDCPHSTPKWVEKGEICLRTTNFQPGYLDLSEVRYVSFETYEERIARLEPQQNDIVYSREGGILGIACIIPNELKACLGQRMMLLRTSQSKCTPKYLLDVLNSPFILNKVKTLTGGTSSPHLNVGDVKQFLIPLPPLLEQHEIVRRVDALFALADRIEARVAAARERTETMRQSILAQAFSGRLVPTEAELARLEGRDYEPASVLLERIRSEKTEKKGGKRVQTTLV
jgi:type I restriction enzyme S subunit